VCAGADTMGQAASPGRLADDDEEDEEDKERNWRR
jgi:hypothetical protein